MSQALRCDYCGCFGETTEKWQALRQAKPDGVTAFEVYRHWCGECDPREGLFEEKAAKERRGVT